MIGALLVGIIAGFLARALMPGRDPMGFLMTSALGLAGSLVGYFLFRAIGIGDADRFDLGGIIGAIIGAMIILGVWRAVAGKDRGRSHRGRPVTH